jgi:putative DNA methylase
MKPGSASRRSRTGWLAGAQSRSLPYRLSLAYCDAMGALQRELQFVDVERKLQPPPAAVPIDESFPEAEANELAKLESYNKNLFRPNTYLHKWWARRSGVTFRFILKQLVPDAERRDYYAPGGLEGITVLDPMMGGGTTLHEAIRLGANVIGYDLDPIPVLQAKASLQNIPLEEKQQVFEEFVRALEKRLRPYFKTKCPTCGELCEVQFILHAVRRSCDCGEALVVDSFLLREEPNEKYKHTLVQDFYPDLKVKRGRKCWRLFEKAKAGCDVCKKPLANCTDIAFTQRYVPLITVGLCSSHGQFFKAAGKEELNAIEKSRRSASRAILPQEDSLRIVRGPKSGDLLSKNIASYAELFTPRQILYITTAKKLLDDTDPRHRIWLALLVSTSLEFNSILTGYKGSDKRRAGAIRHVFSHHAYSFPYTFLESNPVFSQKTSGTLRRLFDDRVKDAGEWAVAPIERQPAADGWRKIAIFGETDSGLHAQSISEFKGKTHRFIAEQRDSSRMPLPDSSVDFVITDPPYFDSVQYSDLSHFFRVWLQWFLPNEADWGFAPVSSAVAETENEAEKYRTVLGAIFSEANRVLKRPHGRLVFTFHHWRADAWIQLTLALKTARFRLVNTFTVHSENLISVHIRQLNALKHDSILVFQPADLPSDGNRFEPIESIKTDDSFAFCRDCARLLGFCLERGLEDFEIERLWRAALGD